MLDRDDVAAVSGSEQMVTPQEVGATKGDPKAAKRKKSERQKRRVAKGALSEPEHQADNDAKASEAEERRTRRVAEKAEREAKKAQEKQEREERAALKKAKREARLAEKDEAKRLKSEKKIQQQEALQTEVDAAAAEARAGEETIQKYAKMSTPVAEQIGNLFLATKPKLKKLRPKKFFKAWIEQECGIKYRTAHNYMTIAKAIAEDPELRERGLTELYELLGLVTRKAKESAAGAVADDDGNDDTGSETTDFAEDADDDGEEDNEGNEVGHDGNVQLATVKVGSLEARFRGGCYVIELEENWDESLTEAVGDVENFAQILRGRGVLLRLKADADLAS